MNLQHRICCATLALGFLLFCPLRGDGENQNYFTFGSTVSEVVAVQGEPDSVVDEPNKLYDKGDVVLRFTLYFSSSSSHLACDDLQDKVFCQSLN